MEIELDNAAAGPGQAWEIQVPGSRLRLEERGDSGALELSLEAADGRSVIAADIPLPGVDWRTEPFRRLAARFVGCVARGVPCAPGFDAGVRVQRLLDAAADSAARNGAVVATEDGA